MHAHTHIHMRRRRRLRHQQHKQRHSSAHSKVTRISIDLSLEQVLPSSSLHLVIGHRNLLTRLYTSDPAVFMSMRRLLV